MSQVRVCNGFGSAGVLEGLEQCFWQKTFREIWSLGSTARQGGVLWHFAATLGGD